MSVIHLIEHNLVLTVGTLGDAPAEDVGYTLRGDPGQAQIAGALKDGMNRMVASQVMGISWFPA
jgi:hypothetical protein